MKAPRPPGMESEEEDGRPMRRRNRRKQAESAVLVGNVPKSVRISEFKAKVCLKIFRPNYVVLVASFKIMVGLVVVLNRFVKTKSTRCE